ncbi:unnamed protein product [Diamesa serratosioi]
MVNGLPHFSCGPIIKGFNRGSKELANYSLDVVEALPKDLDTGIYYGFASVDNGDVYKMVMSIGWNPFYDNTHKSMETHILHNFDGDLYGSLLKVCIVGYLRPEQNFDSLEALIKAIKNDIDQADKLLNSEEHETFKCIDFFKSNFNCERIDSLNSKITKTNLTDDTKILNGSVN